MKNLFKRIGKWLHDNYKYDGFVQMIGWGCITLMILVCNICTFSIDRIDWFIFSPELIFTLWMAERWQNGKRMNKYKESVKWMVDQAYELANTTADKLIIEHTRLVASNRRRKRAERALKKTRLALCNDSADRKLREDVLRFRRTFSPPPFLDSIILYEKIKHKR